MRSIATAVVAFGLLGGCAAGGGDHDRIRALSQEFFDAMERRDADMASRVVIPEGVFVSVRPGSDGRDVRSFTNASWIEGLPNEQRRVRERFTGDPLVIVEGDVAVLWGAYEFEIDDEVTHTGIDVINFIRTDEGWRISGGVYSVESVD